MPTVIEEKPQETLVGFASVAQLAEQLIQAKKPINCNQQVVGSSPTAGSQTGFPAFDKFIGNGFIPGEVVAMIGSTSQGIHPVFSKTYIRRIGVGIAPSPILFDIEGRSDPGIWASLFPSPRKQKITFRSITSDWEPTDKYECNNS